MVSHYDHRDLPAQLNERLHHLIDDRRGETFERFVEQDQLDGRAAQERRRLPLRKACRD